MKLLTQEFETLTFDDWKVRCSSISKIMSKSGKITQGVETYLKEEYNRVARGFYEDFGSKYTDKGNWKEEDVLTIMQDTILSGALPIKNKETKENTYIKGTCDVYMRKANIILDAKNSYSWKTFDESELTENYAWQLIGYMWLWEADSSILFYVLLNLPERQLLELELKMFYQKGKYLTFQDPEFLKDCESLRERYNFEKFPIEDRFKAFVLNRDLRLESDISKMVIKCREWLNDYHSSRLKFRESNRSLILYPV
jgi:hypothetical protein